MPARPERSRIRSAWTGRPRRRLVPRDSTASGISSAAAQRTASSTWGAVAGFRISGMSGTISEPRDLRERHLPLPDVHPPQLGTAVQPGEHLAGVEQAVAVEGAFEALLLLQVGRAELDRK